MKAVNKIFTFRGFGHVTSTSYSRTVSVENLAAAFAHSPNGASLSKRFFRHHALNLSHSQLAPRAPWATSAALRCLAQTSYSTRTRTRQRPTACSLTSAAAVTGAACAMCQSMRLNAACSASSGLSSSLHRHFSVTRPFISRNKQQEYSGHGTHGQGIYGSYHLFGRGMSATTALGSNGPIIATNQNVAFLGAFDSKNGLMQHCLIAANGALSGAIHSSSGFKNTTASAAGATAATASFLLSDAFGGITFEGACSSLFQSPGWTARELAVAIAFASAATAGSLFLGPIDRLRGGGSSGGGSGEGHDSSGGGGPGGGGGGGGRGNEGGRLGHSFDGRAEVGEEEDEKLEIGIASSPRPYEVSVRALRGGRLSMEDEFIVTSGGRFSAVFDGHGGGGVSQYLRDRLHVVIAEHLKREEGSRIVNNKLRKDLKSYMFGKGIHGKRSPQQKESSEGALSHETKSGPTRSCRIKGDLSGFGQLPVSAVSNALQSAFSQVDDEILLNDEFEYQGSTAVAIFLHEGSDGVRTVISANIGDSRAILSRNGTAIDLTRDHKPNDDKEKARILAMGEKIEWDHYCKVHRVRNLSLSRAIGDRFAKPAVSGEVEVQCFPVYDDKDEFILLASDGLWDVMSSQEVVSYVNKRLNAAPKDGADITCEEDMLSLKYLRRKNMSRFIANEALRRGSGDNISVVTVWLNEFDQSQLLPS